MPAKPRSEITNEIPPMKSEIKIQDSNLIATDYRMTATGPIAIINGAWCSVNGSNKLISDIRFQLPKYDLANLGLLQEAITLAESHQRFCEQHMVAAAWQSLTAFAEAQDDSDAAHRNVLRLL